MRYFGKAAVLVVVLALLAPDKLLAAGDYISDAVAALQHASVYVAPDTEGTDKDTAGRLQTRLNKDDNIVLVMLPSSAESELGADTTTIATRLSEELGNQKIIGLAVGNNVVGYAPDLPAGVATDQMRRAKSVSNDPITALGTFAQNIHIWQSENREPSPPLVELPEKGSSTWLVWLGIPIGIAVIMVVGLLFLSTSTSKQSGKERTRFKAPDQVRDLLEKIPSLRKQIKDRELSQRLYQMCLDIEKYFASNSSDIKRDATFFKDRLTSVVQVLTKYIDVQLYPNYYEGSRAVLEKGKLSILDFADYVVVAIKRGHAAELSDYNVNTNILQADKYR